MTSPTHPFVRRSLLVVATTALLVPIAACGGGDDDAAVTSAESTTDSSTTGSAPAGEQPPVSTVVGLSQNHVEGEVDYPQRPPIGGDHNGAWQNCGVYREPIIDEHAVHSLEHGAVWVAYAEDLSDDQIAVLEALADGQTHVLVAPYVDLKRPVILTAWGAQQGFDDVDDPGIADFIREFQQGPQTPEPGAPCTRGVGTPL